MNRRDFLKYSAVGICGFSLPISMIIPEKKNAFIEFAKENFKLNYWKKGIIPFEPTKHHAELADLYDNNRFVLVKKYRQGGFTTMTLLWALHECITKPDVRIVFLARTDREAVDAKYRIIDVALNSMDNKPEIERSNAHRLQFAHGSQMHFMTCHSCCGIAANCIIFDEAAFIPDLEQWWRAMYPTISMGGKAFMVSTPSHTKGYFYELYKRSLKGEGKFVIYAPDWFEHPDCTPEHVEFLKAQLGEKGYRQECLALFQDEPYDLG